ncbi:MAG: hypothetical protein OEV91_08465, partial [Desulfobulbaceae bacterium]|nr:hypothetical protein [Desulfobulbaceae bacterium]
MCEFCTRHGEGRKWYDNIRNYTAELFHEVNSEANLRHFLADFRGQLDSGVARARRWQQRLPMIYRWLVAPWLTRRLQRIHFGQVLPMEDVERILDRVSTIVRLPCVCRRVTVGGEHRCCFGIGLDLTHIFRDLPDFCAFERLTVAEAKAAIRRLDAEGKVHSVWTFNTPFIGAICNCDRDCMAYRFEQTMGLGRAMWKAEYVAVIDPLACNGCKACLSRCYFGAIVPAHR